MDFPPVPLLLIILLILAFGSAGCTSAPASPGPVPTVHETALAEKTPGTETGKPAGSGAASQKESITDQLASVRSDSPVWLEAYRMFRNIKTTEYIHPPYVVDDAAGVYKFDCLGFVDHVLMSADPAGYKVIGKSLNPSIESYAAYFNKLDTAKPDASGWTKIVHPLDLKPGDVCLWLKPTTLDTGHIWIIAGTPSVNPKRSDEVLVRIFDSSIAHSDDSRTGSAFKTGLGSGILGFMTDGQGNPAGLYWDGGVSTSAGEKDTSIVCGRLNR
jgi:hypothetical protein